MRYGHAPEDPVDSPPVSTTIEPRLVTPGGPLAIRPATLADADFVTGLETALYPDEPADPVLTRHRWANENPEWTVERFVLERDGLPIGFAHHRHASWDKLDKRYGRVAAMLDPQASLADRAAAYGWIEDRARAAGTEIFTTYAREDRPADIDFLLGRGYREERRGKEWELDLAARRDHLLAMLAASRARMREQGFRILTLREDADPERYRKTHEMCEEAARDVPTTVPHVPEPLSEFMTWLRSPSVHEDRVFIARVGDDVVGISLLAYPPTRGNVWTAWTGTARAVRGRGVARALKLETVAQAMELGVARVRTGNDAKNDPILHLNEELGYTRIPGWIELHRPAA